jgi:hypothetical protein
VNPSYVCSFSHSSRVSCCACVSCVVWKQILGGEETSVDMSSDHLPVGDVGHPI